MATIKENFDITPLTTFKIGGPVRYFVEIEEKEDLKEVFEKIKTSGLPVVVIGGGSNLLFNSNGFEGWVVKLNLKKIEQKENVLEVEAGASLASLVEETVRLGLGGIHELAGIPGTVGGAVRGNSGAWGVSIDSSVLEVEIFDTEQMRFSILGHEEGKFSYRKSIFSSFPHWIIVAVKFQFKKEDPALLEKERNEIMAKRQKKPYGKVASAGSVFKNVPIEEIKDKERREELLAGFFPKIKTKNSHKSKDPKEVTSLPAGYLIETLGLLGEKVGQAQVSKDHGNIIINLGQATSEDVKKLIDIVKVEVEDELGIKLKEEIVYVG